MSGFFRAVGSLASIAAVIPGPHQPIAAAVAVVSSTVGQITAKQPSQKGTVQGFLVGANQPLPYLIGEAYTEGVELYRAGYGGEVDDVDNPYAWIPRVYSCCGPIQSMGQTLVNHTPVSLSGSVGSVQEAQGYYAEHLYIDQQLGARPEAGALQSPAGWGMPTNWSNAHKLSGFAAAGWSLMWSKKGRRFAGGQIPPLGKIPQGVFAYDPRHDSSRPGGSGSHRIDDEDTWEYTRNPALHALTYAYGRLMNGEPIFGCRLFEVRPETIAATVAWANVCDANGWTVNGTIYEPGDKWDNLKKICEAGGAQPIPGSTLGFDYQAPRTSLYTVTRDDLAGPVRSSLGRGWRNRKNVLIARYREPNQQWGYVQAEAVRNATWIVQDGEEKLDERQWDLVTNVDQVTELATYDLWQRREAGPIELPCKSHMRSYRPGHCLTLHEELGAHPDGEVKIVIRRRSVDVVSGLVTFICEIETEAKHTAAIGLTGGAPAIVPWLTQEQIDTILARNSGSTSLAIASGFTRGLSGQITQSSSGDGTVDVTIPGHFRVYGDGAEVFVSSSVLTLEEGKTYLIYYDDEFREGGSVSYQAINITDGGDAGDAYVSADNLFRHFIARVTVQDAAGAGGSSGGSSPPGGGGWSSDGPDPSIP